MMAGTVDVDYAAERRMGAQSCLAISGCFRRSLDATPATLSVDTTSRAVTLITPSLYIDLRIAADRPPLPKGCTSFAELPLQLLAAVARATHCFGGLGTIGEQVCTRKIAVDWQPPPRLKPNMWRIETQWGAGGWAEWATECDSNGQSKCV